jgi:hypothetical protein
VNATNDYLGDQEIDYQLKFRRQEPNTPRRPRRPEHGRPGRPTGFNGMHRRRNKRYY